MAQRISPLISSHRAEIEALCCRHHVRRLELFGSTATGEERPDSDVDFLVVFEPLPFGTYSDTYFGLKEALEALLARQVDLVVDSTIKNPYFRKSVERSKVLLYAA